MRPKPKGASTPALVAWAFYDWANSSYAAVIQTFIFAAYFTRSVASNEVIGSSQWGMTVSFAGLFVALTGPILGALADAGGNRKKWLAILTAFCVLSTASLWWVLPTPSSVPLALTLVILSTVTTEFCYIFYNAMLPDLVPSSHIGRWSGWGWSLGYVGGMLSLLVALWLVTSDHLAWIPLDHSSAAHIRATFVLCALWYFVFSLPLFLFTPETRERHRSAKRVIRQGLKQLWETFTHIRKYSYMVRFLIARLFYIDGLTTLFAYGGVYAAGVFGLSAHEVIVFGITLNVFAGIGSAIGAFVDDFFGSRNTILASLIGLTSFSIAILLVKEERLFWIFGVCIGLFVGPVQASSRSLMARLAPEHMRTEMFGFFAFSGKATAFVGPAFVAWVTYLTQSQRLGMSTIVLFFLFGGALLSTLPSEKKLLRN